MQHGDCSSSMSSSHSLPDFENPPVVETVLSVSFRKIPALNTAMLVKFWNEYLSTELPEIEEHSSYSPSIEFFGLPRGSYTVDLDLSRSFPSPRFFCSSGNDLVQLQVDWFAYNWRKTSESPEYSRYEKGRDKFRLWLREFQTFLKESLDVPNLEPTQCEVTYVNHIELTPDDLKASPFGRVLQDINPTTGKFLPAPETARYGASYMINEGSGPLGRLHIHAEHVVIEEEPKTVLFLNLTARGKPLSADLEGVLGFIDIGREWLVRGFVDITTSCLHQRWGLAITQGGKA